MASSAVGALQSRLTQSIFELVSPFLKLTGAGDLAGLPVPERFSHNKRLSPKQNERSALAQRQEILRALHGLTQASQQLLQIVVAFDEVDVRGIHN